VTRLAFSARSEWRALPSAGTPSPDEIIIQRAEFSVSMQCFELIVHTQEGANHEVRNVRKILNLSFATVQNSI
jgi:hypothetical protein